MEVPQPDPQTGRYDSREVAAWRKSVGVSSTEVAQFLGVARPYIARLERDETMSAAAGRKVIYAVHRRLDYRERMMRNGRETLDAIRGERGR